MGSSPYSKKHPTFDNIDYCFQTLSEIINGENVIFFPCFFCSTTKLELSNRVISVGIVTFC
jgi:hypothetical protein